MLFVKQFPVISEKRAEIDAFRNYIEKIMSKFVEILCIYLKSINIYGIIIEKV